MKKLCLLGIFVLIALGIVGCSLDVRDMGIPFVATNTRTPLPPVQHTPTPTYLPKSGFQGELLQTEILEDDTTLLSDPELGYQAVFSPEWLVVILSSPLEQQLPAGLTGKAADAVSTLVSANSQKTELRMLAMDYTGKYSTQFLVNLMLGYTPKPTALSTNMQDLVEKNIELIPTQVPGTDVIYQNVQVNAHGLEYGKLILTQTDPASQAMLKKLVAYFKVSEGLLTLTGTALEEDFTSLEAAFQKAIDAIQLVN